MLYPIELLARFRHCIVNRRILLTESLEDDGEGVIESLAPPQHGFPPCAAALDEPAHSETGNRPNLGIAKYQINAGCARRNAAQFLNRPRIHRSWDSKLVNSRVSRCRRSIYDPAPKAVSPGSASIS